MLDRYRGSGVISPAIGLLLSPAVIVAESGHAQAGVMADDLGAALTAVFWLRDELELGAEVGAQLARQLIDALIVQQAPSERLERTLCDRRDLDW